MSGDKDKTVTGTFQPPPPEAPRQVTAPGSEQPTAEQIARASANTIEPPSFTPPPMTREQMVAMIGEEAVAAAEARGEVKYPAADTAKPSQGRGIRRVSARPAVDDGESTPAVPAVPDAAPAIILTDADPTRPPTDAAPRTGSPIVAPSDHTALPVQAFPTAPAVNPMPAASNTDTPSRGIPRAILDPGKTITGGFGDAMEAQYFPLDGIELREAVLAMMDALAARLQNDLRFSIAVTYPRVTARVIVEVEAYADSGFTVPVAPFVHDKTPIAVARAHGHEIVFVVSEQLQEMDGEGNSVTPPNAVRADLGLQVPRKQRVETPNGGMIVDAVTALSR